MRALFESLRQTIRVLLKAPGFTITAQSDPRLWYRHQHGSFSPISTVLLNPLPFPQADRLVQIFQSRTSKSVSDRSEWGGLSYPDATSGCQRWSEYVGCRRRAVLGLFNILVILQLPQRVTAIYALRFCLRSRIYRLCWATHLLAKKTCGLQAPGCRA